MQLFLVLLKDMVYINLRQEISTENREKLMRYLKRIKHDFENLSMKKQTAGRCIV